jgi:hypothetical protein
MLSVDDKLDWETMARIFRTGFSRIPVFSGSRVSQPALIIVLPVDEALFSHLIHRIFHPPAEQYYRSYFREGSFVY